MRARLSFDDPSSLDTPLFALPVVEEEDAPSTYLDAFDRTVGDLFRRARESGDFRGKADESLLIYLPPSDGESLRRVLFLGIGREEEVVDLDVLRSFAARAVRKAESISATSLTLALPERRGAAGSIDRAEIGPADAVQAIVEGAALAAWDFRELRAAPGDGGEWKPLVEEMVLVGTDDAHRQVMEEGLRIGLAFAEGENLARTLQERPGNVATPTHLATTAEELAARHGFRSRILGREELEAEGMRALLAVSAGSEEEPRLIVLEHRGGREGEPPLAIVGKGLTFDSGGISIKPAAGMEEMKYDMSGGAAVLGAMHAIGLLGLPLNVVAVIPSSENLLSGKAVKPGDVIRSRAGKTIEVVNTDAEGRLILADALSYVVDRHSPKAVVDCATLTGACVIALGHQAAAVLGTDEALVSELRAAGDRSGERCWELPLWKAYRKQIDSTVADLKNTGGRPAGTITAAWFLAEFVGTTPWAHLDIAGTAYGDTPASHQRKGGYGIPTRLLLEWIRGRAE